MSLLSIIAVLVIIGFLLKWYKSNRPEGIIQKYEENAELFISGLKTIGKIAYGKEELDEEVLQMKDWYIRLKEKYKHDNEKLVMVAQDWMDYIFNKDQYSTGFYLMLENNDEDRDRRDELKENIFKSEEIENRFAHLLGQEYEDQLRDGRRKKKEESEKFRSV
ncbi:hypothetical protein KW782_03660 [Candidatus Parcubacteria bacterium]|nr:hypothetical protein [Candidatus Parcubacteria bacterium]